MNTKAKQIFIIGNGVDLTLGLSAAYSDFLNIIKDCKIYAVKSKMNEDSENRMYNSIKNFEIYLL